MINNQYREDLKMTDLDVSFNTYAITYYKFYYDVILWISSMLFESYNITIPNNDPLPVSASKQVSPSDHISLFLVGALLL